VLGLSAQQRSELTAAAAIDPQLSTRARDLLLEAFWTPFQDESCGRRLGKLVYCPECVHGPANGCERFSCELDPFSIERYPVTNRQFKLVCGIALNGHPDEPAQVTLPEARRYCLEVGKRLPTPRELEHAVRFGTSTILPWVI